MARKSIAEITRAVTTLIRIIIYVRVSSEKQEEGFSLQTQIDECKERARQLGYVVVKVFTDVYTGDSLDRPGLDALREFIAADETITIMLVHSLDRLARRATYQMLIEDELKRHGVTVESVRERYDDTDEGRLHRQIHGAISEYERAKIQERTKRGRRGKARAKNVLVGARPPYGYDVVKLSKRGRMLAVNASEAAIVKLIFKWFIQGVKRGEPPLSIHAIARRLTEMRVPTRGDSHRIIKRKFGKGVWQPAMVRHILTNETFIGRWHYGKTEMIDDGKQMMRISKGKRGLGKQVARPRDQWIEVPVPKIIALCTWNAAVARLAHIQYELNGRPTKHDYLLSRRLTCSKCGYHVRGQYVHRKLQYYLCGGRRQIVARCDMPSFRGEWVDAAVWNWVRDLMLHPDRLAAGLRREQDEMQKSHSALRERLEIIDGLLASTRAQLERVLGLYIRGGVPGDLLDAQLARAEKDQADLSRERAELAAHLESAVLTDAQIAELEAFCVEVREGLDHATFEDKRRYFELLDVRGKLAVENDERVVYVRCKIGEQRLVQIATSPSSSNHFVTSPYTVSARLVIGQAGRTAPRRKLPKPPIQPSSHT